MIKIITVGKIKEKYLKDGINEYLKRMQKYTKIEIIELQDEDFDINKTLLKEKEKIEKYIKERDYVVTLEIDGEELSSIELSKKIDNIMLNEACSSGCGSFIEYNIYNWWFIWLT